MTGSGGAEAPPASGTAALGLGFAVGSFLIWALFPIYFKQLETVPAVEVLAHRVVWSAFFTAGLLTFLGRWRAVVIGLASLRADRHADALDVHHFSQLGRVHLGSLEQPNIGLQPSLLHQSARQRPAWRRCASGTPACGAVASGGAGRYRRWL